MKFIYIANHLSAFCRGVIATLCIILAPLAVASSDKTKKPTHHKVQITGFQFIPEKLEVAKGDTITWTNKDIAPHSVVIKQTEVAINITPTLNNGQSFTYQVSQNFNYQCGFHPSMQGQILIPRSEN